MLIKIIKIIKMRLKIKIIRIKLQMRLILKDGSAALFA